MSKQIRFVTFDEDDGDIIESVRDVDCVTEDFFSPLCMVWCVEWYDKDNKRHIKWNEPYPEQFRDKLIKQGIDPATIDIYEKDVS